MEAYLPQHTKLGELEMVEVHDFYDRPVLFTCKNTAGQFFLVVWVGESDDEETWLYVPVSSTRYNLIQSGVIDLHDAFAKAEDNVAYRVAIPFAFERHTGIERVAANMLPEDYLPEAGELLNHALFHNQDLDHISSDRQSVPVRIRWQSKDKGSSVYELANRRRAFAVHAIHEEKILYSVEPERRARGIRLQMTSTAKTEASEFVFFRAKS